LDFKQDDTLNADKNTNDIRRKLLKAVVYAPPVILGSMVATPRTVMGAIGATKVCTFTDGTSSTITVSSGTNACCPCLSKTTALGTIIYSTNYNINKCKRLRCLYSCGTNCPPGVIATVRCRRFCRICGFTVAGCKKPCTCSPHPTKPGKFKCV